MTCSTFTVTLDQARWFRMRRSGLVDPFASAEAAAAELAGIQAQIHPAAGLALWNRTPDLTHAGYERMLFADRTLVKLWGQRGTLHAYASADWPLVCGMLAGTKSWWGRSADRAEQYDAYAELVERAAALLEEKQVMGRSDLRAAGLTEEAEHLSPWGGIFADLVRHGYACHAARDGEGLFASRSSWLPGLAWDPPERDAANVAMLRRYLRTYGPATLQDFKYWRGVKSADAQRWWAAVEPELATVAVDGSEQSILRADIDELLAPSDALADSVRMLYRFDPFLLAHKDKRWLVPAAHHKQVFRIAGHIEGVILDRGRAIATWRYVRKGRGLTIVVEPFGRIPQRVRRKEERTAPRIAAYFDVPLQEIVEQPFSLDTGPRA
ncbi:MAG: winged helix DNA-binding domain-containing protein [Caldilinea sp.]|nr:AlkZ family DNA glycosylase [Caldilinea sp.]MCB9122782.1 AlkZ family DNA glycosylase [Caldilineaceae bacterium]MCB9124229.1 AlkZ family DNA glycosylase [Caldilineaceae bacterium]MCO5210258.1 winged helix DNA-binding domain-containing protein [Caldilinea sp.]MCW5840664.1 AlkZ family DNA glycosylase [Caldilinea sp.]